MAWPVQVHRAGVLLRDDIDPYLSLAPDAPSKEEMMAKEVRTVAMVTNQAVVAIDCDHGVKGHRRALEEFDPTCGYRIWEVVPSPAPVATFGTRVFGLSQGAAIPNLALVWPQRFTWHSDFQVRLCNSLLYLSPLSTPALSPLALGRLYGCPLMTSMTML